MATQRQIVMEILLDAGTEFITTAEVFEKIPKQYHNYFTDGTDQVSKILNALRSNDQVENGPSEIVGGRSRLTWRTTSKGRTSLLVWQEDDGKTDDAKETQTEQELEPIRDTDSHTGASPNELDAISEQIIIVKFDTSDYLDRSLLAMVNMIRTASEDDIPAIERKAEKLALLEKMENNDLLPGNTRALLGYIRQDIERLGDAA